MLLRLAHGLASTGYPLLNQATEVLVADVGRLGLLNSVVPLASLDYVLGFEGLRTIPHDVFRPSPTHLIEHAGVPSLDIECFGGGYRL